MTPQGHQAPNCLKCRHYYITYLPHQPHGCRAYGFKSREMPTTVVFASSKIICGLFASR